MSDSGPTHTRCQACDAYVPGASQVCLQCGAHLARATRAVEEETDFLSRLERLHRLHASGGLSDEEFSLAKTRLLRETRPPSSAHSQDSSLEARAASKRAETDPPPAVTPSCPRCQSHYVSRLRFFEKKNRRHGVGCMGCFVLVAILVLTPGVLLLGTALGNDRVGNLAVPLLVLLVVASGLGLLLERSKAGVMICEACGHKFRTPGATAAPPIERPRNEPPAST